MKTLCRWLRRVIRHNLIGTCVEIVSLLLITLVVYLNFNLSEDILLSLEQDAAAAAHGFDVTVKTPDGSAVTAEDFPVMTQNGALPIYTAVAQNGSVSGINYYLTVRTDVSALSARELTTVTQGRLPQAADEAAVLSYKAQITGLSVGDVITVIEDNGMTRAVKICGFLSGVSFLDNVRPDMLELLMPQTDSVAAQMILLDSDTLGIDPYVLRKTYPGLYFEITDAAKAAHETDNVRPVLLLLCGVMTVITVALIAALTNNRLEERLHDYAVFRSVGAPGSKWTALLYLENLFYALPASVLGVLTGEAARVMLITKYYGADAATRRIRPVFIFASIAVTVLFVAAVTAIARSGARRTTLRDALVSTPSCAYRYAIRREFFGAVLLLVGTAAYVLNRRGTALINEAVLLCLIVGITLFLPFLTRAVSRLCAGLVGRRTQGPLYLSLRRLAQSKNNITGIRLVCAMVALCSAFLFTVVSVNAFFTEYAKKFGYDVTVYGTDINEETSAFILEQDGVSSLFKEYAADGFLLNGRGEAVSLKVIKQNGYFYGITYLDGAPETLTSGQCILDKLFALQNGLKIGSVVPFSTGKEEPVYLTVVGYCDSTIYHSGRDAILLSDEDYFTCVTTAPSRICITLEEGYAQSDALSSLSMLSFLKLDKNISVTLNSYHFDMELSRTMTALKLFSTLPVLVVILAVAGLINSQLLAFRRRKREYAVLYAVGMSHRQIYRTVLYETIAVFIIGAVVGSLLGLYLLLVLRDVLYTMISYVPLTVPTGPYLAVLFGLCLFVTIVSLLPYRTILHANVTEEIRKDN